MSQLTFERKDVHGTGAHYPDQEDRHAEEDNIESERNTIEGEIDGEVRVPRVREDIYASGSSRRSPQPRSRSGG
jgi:hypothetical protein